MRECSISGCSRRVLARGWCGTHYQRWRLAGDPMEGGRYTRTLREKFEKILVDRPAGDVCWLWPNWCDADGYGEFRADGQRLAHKAAYLIYNGDIPAGQIVMHTCDVPSCCNPAHLVLGTQRDNMQDMANKGRSLSGERNPHAKLTDDAVRDMRTRHAAGVPVTALASEYGVTYSPAWAAVTRKTWRHVV